MMLETEQLNMLLIAVTKSPVKLDRMKRAVLTAYNSEDYQEWLSGDCREAPVLSSESEFSLQEFGLIENGRLLIKINRLRTKYFLTDGAWVDHRLRVFPDPDEAELLVTYARQNQLDQSAEWVIDPAAGCGHTPIAIDGNAKRVSCDVNARAVLFATLNSRLNGMTSDGFISFLNNMNDGFPSMMPITGNTLILANVPFAQDFDATSRRSHRLL